MDPEVLEHAVQILERDVVGSQKLDTEEGAALTDVDDHLGLDSTAARTLLTSWREVQIADPGPAPTVGDLEIMIRPR